MTIPGFTAEASVYEGAGQYRAPLMLGTRSTPGISPAYATTDLASGGLDPCRLCSRMTGCAKSRCLCRCDGGIAISNSHAHCGFLCT
jgi:hypothetical protein